MKNIGLFTSVYFNNIGNAFIDFGAQATIEGALPDGYQLVKVSQFQTFVNAMKAGMGLRESRVVRAVWNGVMKNHAHKIHDKLYTAIPTKKTITLMDYVKLDALIIPGCVLTVPFFKIFGAELEALKNKGTELIFLGASGNYYTDYEVSFVKEYIKKLEPKGIIFRDHVAYENYKDIVEVSHNGIDNAFFVNKVTVPKNIASEDYVVLNFDHPKSDHMIQDLSGKFNKVVVTNNKPYPLSYVKSLLAKDIFVSDTPLDYLILLANAKEVHSDRVHSCIPTLSFGGKCRIYSHSKRVALFDNVNLSNVKNEVVGITNLSIYQDEKINNLRNILREI
ncbi:TPA: polysaccharide pyruvyl transferase family protein [Klebsiella pneumoniae]|nr:polysaccharide pyruvyl transferase family protein [Klebsiella pneumoniae]